LVVIVPDQLYETIKQTHQPYVVRNIDVTQQKDSEKLTEELLKISSKDNDLKIGSFYKAYVDVMDMNGLTLFVGIFLGAVFVLETGSIIYYK
ncbi:ABC transporter permease, partial [Bacillus pseudomycoides]